MRALLLEAGLVDVAVESLTVLLEDYALANQILEGTVTRAQEAGLVNAADGERWLATLQDASVAGRFFGSLRRSSWRAESPEAHARSVLNKSPPPELQ